MPMCVAGIPTVKRSNRWTAAVTASLLFPTVLLVYSGTLRAQDATVDAAASAPAAPPDAAPATPPAAVPATAPAAGELPSGVEALFADYLHFARMGKFDAAELYVAALLKHDEFKPKTMLALAEKYRNSRETLLMLIDGSSIRENAAKVLQKIREGEVVNRKNQEQIAKAIDLLAGDPTQRTVGTERLQYAGEYAVPWIVDRLRDVNKKELYPFIERTLPKLGKSAMNPLVVSLRVKEDAVRETLIDGLGALGYPQALPYLKRYAEDSKQTDSVRKTAAGAIAKILKTDPGLKDLPAAAGFLHLAGLYYADTASLRADEREELANVWYCKDDALTSVAVPRQIFNSVMCMRCCEEALALQPEQPEAVALWLAANFRREAALGMDVRSVDADPKALADKTRPENYPRSVYFARCFGPRYSLMALTRGVRDHDAVVALGAVNALEGIAGGQAVFGEGKGCKSLVEALSFPDSRVRVLAALTLGETLPAADFQGSHLVVPILASAIDLRGASTVLIAHPDAAARQVLGDLAKRNGAQVFAASTVSEAANEARQVAADVDLIVLASEAESPGVVETVRQLRSDDRLGLAPVVIAVRPGSAAVVEQVATVDRRVDRLVLRKVDELSDDETAKLNEAFMQAWDRARKSYGRQAISPEEAQAISMRAISRVMVLAMSGPSVFQLAEAEPALVRACSHTDVSMRLAAATALIGFPSEPAQAAIAKLAMEGGLDDANRVTAFNCLAESAKRCGRKIDNELVAKLTEQALREANLVIRTAASRALGAFNLAAGRAAEIIGAQSAQ